MVCSTGQRQQANLITHFLDGSVVYGSSKSKADALRSFEGGKMKVREFGGHIVPPENTKRCPASRNSRCPFDAGDHRIIASRKCTSPCKTESNRHHIITICSVPKSFCRSTTELKLLNTWRVLCIILLCVASSSLTLEPTVLPCVTSHLYSLYLHKYFALITNPHVSLCFLQRPYMIFITSLGSFNLLKIGGIPSK